MVIIGLFIGGVLKELLSIPRLTPRLSKFPVIKPHLTVFVIIMGIALVIFPTRKDVLQTALAPIV